MPGGIMIRSLAFLTAACLLSSALAGDSDKEVTWTGWFSDSQCAAARAASGFFTETNPDCAESCIRKGAAPVFISEQAKAIFTVKGYASVIDDLGYHLEVKATVSEAAKTMSIINVKRLEYQGAACSRPRKRDTKK
jgi:hypothetical protein